jgi:hypothetical protein
MGAKVRVAVYLNLFEKKSQARWSKELFTIVRREGFSSTRLPVDEVQDRPKVDVEYLPAVAAEPAVMEPLDINRPSPDKVLRKAVRDEEAVLIPATEAMAVVLRHGLTKKPSMDALKAMFPTTGKVEGKRS